jgi:hypothetical protein
MLFASMGVEFPVPQGMLVPLSWVATTVPATLLVHVGVVEQMSTNPN